MLFFCLVPLFLTGFSINGSFPKPFTKEEEKACLFLLQNGTEEEKKQAQDDLVLHNLRLVAHIVKKYSAGQKDTEEMISIGTIGLMKAIQTFNPSKKIRLASYAAKCVQNEILMYLRNNKKSSRDISLYDPIGTDRDGNEIVMLDIIGSDTPDFADRLDFSIRSQKMLSALTTVLTKREQTVICLRYGLGNYDILTQQEIASRLGISRSYVSRIESKALRKLRTQFTMYE